MNRQLPEVIKKVGFDFHWDESKVWKLKIPAKEFSIIDLEWHFSIPFWSSVNGYYDLTPNEVLTQPDRYPDHSRRIANANLNHPLDIMFWKNRWVLLDGLHRLAKAKTLGLEKVKVRKIPIDAIEEIKK